MKPALAATLALALGACAPLKGSAPPPPVCAAGGTTMARVELIFGLETASGVVDESTWRDFLAKEVTPRFPDGLTALDGYGQWKNPADGRIGHEASKVLLIWYTPSPDAETKIQAIRAAYKARFNQLSVMRVDGEDCVSF